MVWYFVWWIFTFFLKENRCVCSSPVCWKASVYNRSGLPVYALSLLIFLVYVCHRFIFVWFRHINRRDAACRPSILIGSFCFEIVFDRYNFTLVIEVYLRRNDVHRSFVRVMFVEMLIWDC